MPFRVFVRLVLCFLLGAFTSQAFAVAIGPVTTFRLSATQPSAFSVIIHKYPQSPALVSVSGSEELWPETSDVELFRTFRDRIEIDFAPNSFDLKKLRIFPDLKKMTFTYASGRVIIRDCKQEDSSHWSAPSVAARNQIVFEPGNRPVPWKIYFQASEVGKEISSVKTKKKKARFEEKPKAETLTSAAIEQNIRDLLRQPTRPTIAQVISLIPQEQSPFPLSDSWRFAEHSLGMVARAIAQMEKAYPGAVWYILGRDAYLLGDFFDAYYTYLGQSGRVVRLPASAPSFDPFLANDQPVVEFMKTYGLDFTTILEGPPRIIIDFTSYSKGWRLS